jgi:hypothetical protein
MEFNPNRDTTYERAMKFVDNMSKKRDGVSNVYVFTAIDKDGKIVDEKYGMNLMTNTGFRSVYAEGAAFAASDNLKLYIGTDVSDPSTDPYSVTDTSIRIPAFGGLAATLAKTTDEVYPIDGASKSYQYPMYYSKGEREGEGLITLISRFMVAYYDYNISGYPDQISITEYGVGTEYNNLWTHSRVYDVQGDPGSMTKDPTVRLYITVYMCLSFYESIIMNGWAQDRYVVITSNAIMYDRMAWNNSKLWVYKRGDVMKEITSGGTQRTQDTAQNNSYTNSTIAPRIILHDYANTNAYDTSSKIMTAGYIDGFVFSDSGFLVIEPQFLTEPEDVSLVNFRSANPLTHKGFSNKFGLYPNSGYTKEQYPQMTHFFDAHAYLFDFKTGDWTNEVDVYNPDSKWYDETPSQTSAAKTIYYSNNREILTAYVYQNIRPNDRITGITSGGVTIYATNKYWAVSDNTGNQDPDKGWVWIRDYNNIPTACQTARYWITNTESDSLSFVRASDTFQLLVKGTNSNGYNTYPEFTRTTYIKSIADNFDYGWYKRGSTVYVPQIRRTFTVGNDSNETMTYGKWMVVFLDTSKKLLVADMSQATSGTITTLPDADTTVFSSSVNMLSQTHRTESGTGIICIEATNVDECVVVDLRNPTFTYSLHSWKHACCIWGTSKIAYINTTDSKVYIYDVDTGIDDGNPIDFPDGLSDIPHIFGHSHYVWMTNGSSFGYIVDIDYSTRTPQGFTYTGLYGSDLQTVKYTCVDDVFIVYKSNESGSSDIPKAHYIELSDPTHPEPLTAFNATGSYIGGRIDIILRYINYYTNTLGNETGALMMLINRGNGNSSTSNTGADCRIADFGQFLHTGVVNWTNTTFSKGSDYCNICLYGEYMIENTTNMFPLMNAMPIKLTGKTDTINTMKYIKNITGKSWLIGYTNTPTWGDGTAITKGKPPGVPLAITDRNGTITGWS